MSPATGVFPGLDGDHRREWAFEVGFVSDPGRVRERNEDAYVVRLPYAGDGGDGAFDALFAVADGMGGHRGGNVASRLVAETLEAAFGTNVGQDDPGRWIQRVIREANRRILEAARRRQDLRGMGSTLTLAAAQGGTLHLGHVGDSRCYRLRDGTLEQLTPDHSWVAEQRRAGLLSAEEEARHPRRNVLTRCLGGSDAADHYVAAEPLVDGTRYLLCTDGLHGLVPDGRIRDVLVAESDPQAASRRLVELALHAGGTDNVTVLVLHVGRVAELSMTLPEGTAQEHRSPSGPGRRSGLRSSAGRQRLLLVGGGLLLATATGLGGWILLRPAATPPGGPGSTVREAAPVPAPLTTERPPGAEAAGDTLGPAAPGDTADRDAAPGLSDEDPGPRERGPPRPPPPEP